MSTKVQHSSPLAGTTAQDSPGLGPRKTLFVLVTVVGCIAILWPKIFHPMMFGPSNQTPKSVINSNFKPGSGGELIF